MRFLVLFSLVFSLLAEAQEVEVRDAGVENFRLSFRLQDAQEVSNACDFVFKRFEYLSSLNAILVRIEPQSCLMDVRGKRKVEVIWPLPLHLRRKAELKLIVNDQELGILQIENREARFEPRDEKEENSK